MKKYDFETMSSIWKDEARTITENGVFVASSGNWDLWEYAGIIYSIPAAGSGCAASVWCGVPNLRRHLYQLRQICGYDTLIPPSWEDVNYNFLGGLMIA